MERLKAKAFEQTIDLLKNRKGPNNSKRNLPKGSMLAIQVRTSLGLSQRQFSERYGLAIGTVRNWEQGRSEPDAASLLLIRIIASDPDGVALLARELEDA